MARSKFLPLKDKKKLAIILFVIIASQKRRKNRKLWVREWLTKRNKLGCYENLMKELALQDAEGYRRWIRMDTNSFEILLEKVSPFITKQNTVMREAIPAGERLALTLRYLATGETQSSLAYNFRIAKNTISNILPVVCKAIYDVLKNEYLKVPNSEDEWAKVAYDFNALWNFPLCIGAMDGKHVKILPPPGSGSSYFNYKGEFSIVLLALVDANLNFIFVDVGTNGRISDGGVWAKCNLKKALDNNILNIPESGCLPHTNVLVPYVIVADDAFPLSNNIMKPYPGKGIDKEKKIFNYRLSRARRVAENAFGILAARFQIYRCSINSSISKVKSYVLATCALHNYLNITSRHSYITPKNIDTEDLENCILNKGDYRNNVNSLVTFKKRGWKTSQSAKEIQNRFCRYFNSVGSVPWQDAMCDFH